MTDEAHWPRDTRPPSRLDLVILAAIALLALGIGAGVAWMQHEVAMSQHY